MRVELCSLLESSTEQMEVYIAHDQEENPDTPVNTYQYIKRLHEVCNYKSADGMIYGYENAKWFDDRVERDIERVVKNCNSCLLQTRFPCIPKVTLPKTTKSNEVTCIDLKQQGKHHILYVVCSVTKFIQGIVINNKEMTTIVAALHHGWCMEWGIPIIRFYSNNGGEFRNILMDEYCAKMGISIRFGPAWSPWSPWGNRCNERNHATTDKTVAKLISENKHLPLQYAVDEACCNHNTNKNKRGYCPMELVTGNSVRFPGISEGDLTNHTEYGHTDMRYMMARHFQLMEDYVKEEFRHKI